MKPRYKHFGRRTLIFSGDVLRTLQVDIWLPFSRLLYAIGPTSCDRTRPTAEIGIGEGKSQGVGQSR